MRDVSRCLVDTPLLVRLANSSGVLHAQAMRAVTELHLRGAQLCITPQNLIEFRNVGTRSLIENGLGYSVKQVEEKAEEFEAPFTLLDYIPEIYRAWKSLVHQAGIIGKQVHDARLVACCKVHGVDSILSFNGRHFVRFIPHMSGLNFIDPHSI